MARTQNLSEYLTDIATAIKTKKEDDTPINASKFDEEIANLKTGEDIYEYFVESIITDQDYFANQLLIKIPNIDTAGTVDLDYAFRGCSNLEEIPLIDTSSVKTMDSIFDGCKKLKHIPLINTANVTRFSNAFRNCISLVEIPAINTNNASSFSQMFYSCADLITLPEIQGGKVTSVNNMFGGCSDLTNIGGIINLGEAYSTTQSANYSNYELKLTSCSNLTHDSLMNVINNLYDIKTKGCNTQKLTLGNKNLPKLTAEEIQICTDKGWTVS